MCHFYFYDALPWLLPSSLLSIKDYRFMYHYWPLVPVPSHGCTFHYWSSSPFRDVIQSLSSWSPPCLPPINSAIEYVSAEVMRRNDVLKILELLYSHSYSKLSFRPRLIQNRYVSLLWKAVIKLATLPQICCCITLKHQSFCWTFNCKNSLTHISRNTLQVKH